MTTQNLILVILGFMFGWLVLSPAIKQFNGEYPKVECVSTGVEHTK